MTYTHWEGSKAIPSTIVTSTALHAAILKDSEALRATHGIERFKIAAGQNITTFFDATVKLDDGTRQWNPRTKAFEDIGETTLEGPFAYLISTTSVDRLEPNFVIAPTRRFGSEKELDRTLDVVILRPLRDPQVREAGEHQGAVWAKRAQEVLGAAYQEGKHIELEYEDGQPVVEVFRTKGFEWIPAPGDDRSRTVCADGSLYDIPVGKSARAELRLSGQDGFWAWV